MARRVTETGRLLRGTTGLVLMRDDGGTWQLDAPRGAEACLGHRVRIVALRIGFDRLSVEDMTPL
jgi:hypothetical protein